MCFCVHVSLLFVLFLFYVCYCGLFVIFKFFGFGWSVNWEGCVGNMMFYKYPEIENAYQDGFIQHIKDAGYGDFAYLVTEKVHGANTQFTYNLLSKEFFIGSRSKFLEDGEPFFNVQACVEPFKDNVLQLVSILSDELAKYGQRIVSVSVFGEVCGGCYPHPDVPLDKKAVKVQKGVYYSPSNQWLVFDVGYVLAGSDRMFFLPGSKFVSSCLFVGLPVVPVLSIAGSLDEALAFPNSGDSVVFERYDLPKLDGNTMEGIVIRPQFVDAWFGHSRLVLKSKNDAFKEKWKTKRGKEAEKADVPEKVKQAMDEISQYINRNRVHNVISHIGEVSSADVGKVIMLVSQDVLSDYRKEYDTLSFLDKKDEKMVTKFMNGEVAKCVRDVIVYGMD